MSEDNDLILWTVTLHNRGLAVVKAQDEVDALQLGENIAKFLPAAASGPIAIRPPTDAERRHYVSRATRLPSDTTAVALP